jgi:hypothetical protein
MPRMKILNSVEREVFDWPPIFNSVERKRCFDFPTPLQDIATSLRTAGNQLVFLLDPRRPLCSRLSLAQLNDIFGSQFAILYLFHNRSDRKTQLRVRIH